MAQSLDINSSTYAGELSLPYVRAAVLAADSVANGYITLKDGIKYKAVLKKLTGGTIVANSCDFSATEGSLDLDEVLITTTELAIMEEICKKDFSVTGKLCRLAQDLQMTKSHQTSKLSCCLTLRKSQPQTWRN